LFPRDTVDMSAVHVVEATLNLLVLEIIISTELLRKRGPQVVGQLRALLGFELLGEGEDFSDAFGPHTEGA
jgi:hypothetical protein